MLPVYKENLLSLLHLQRLADDRVNFDPHQGWRTEVHAGQTQFIIAYRACIAWSSPEIYCGLQTRCWAEASMRTSTAVAVQ
jgi:hypothetical protein